MDITGQRKEKLGSLPEGSQELATQRRVEGSLKELHELAKAGIRTGCGPVPREHLLSHLRAAHQMKAVTLSLDSVGVLTQACLGYMGTRIPCYHRKGKTQN